LNTLAERFWAKVDKRGPDECWDWTAFRCWAGYGRIIIKGNRGETASRVSWELHNGLIPSGMFVCHSCDRPICVNPAHLFLGHHEDNMRDMVAKGRSPKPLGERHHSAKLTAEQVKEMRAEHARGGVTMRDLAKRSGLDPSSVRAIIRRECWKSV
jgi:HNH endonuclease